MALDPPPNTPSHTTQIFPRPNIPNLKTVFRATQFLQLRDFTKLNLPPRFLLQCIHRQHQRARFTSSTPILSRIGSIKSPIRVNAPFIRLRRLSEFIILMKRQQHFVLQYRDFLRCEYREIGANDKRRFHSSPEREVTPRFREREVPVADVQHVEIVVTPEIGVVAQEGAFVQDFGDAGPPRCDVACYAPRGAGAGAPGLNSGVAPVAEGVEDRAVLGKEGVAHYAVANCGERGAPVVTGRRRATGLSAGGAGAGPVDVWSVGLPLIRHAGAVDVGPVVGHVAVVVF